MCDTGHWLSEGVSDPSPVSLEDFIFCWLFGLFPEFSVANGLRSSDPKDSSMAGVDECLDLPQCRSHGSPCFSSLQQDRCYCGVTDPDFDVDGRFRCGQNALHLEEGCSCSANSQFYFGIRSTASFILFSSTWVNTLPGMDSSVIPL